MADGPYAHRMPGDMYARQAPFMEVQRRLRSASSTVDNHDTWINQQKDVHRCHLALARTTVLIGVGGTSPVTVLWPGDAFADAGGNLIPYGVEILPTGLVTLGTATELSHDALSVTVNVTATVLIAVGTQFIVHGCSRLY